MMDIARCQALTAVGRDTATRSTDLVELATLLAALSESAMAVNSEMMAKARHARATNT